jgi:hypothetical protein
MKDKIKTQIIPMKRYPGASKEQVRSSLVEIGGMNVSYSGKMKAFFVDFVK